MTTVFKTSFSLTTEVSEMLTARGENRSYVINRDLVRLYTLYRRALATVDLSTDEACLLIDALNGTTMNADTARMLWAEVEDACQIDHLDRKWEVDGRELVEKIKGLNEIQCMALIDAAERALADPDNIQVERFFNVE